MNPSGTDTGHITNKLNESNFYVWKQKMELVLMLRGVENTITTINYFHSGMEDYDKWNEEDKAACAVWISLPDNTMKQTRDDTSAKEVLDTISHMF